MAGNGGVTVWLTGLPSAGKSTLADALAERLAEGDPRPVTLLDGDELRRTVCADLGFSVADRAENVRRIGALALEAAGGGGLAVVAVIAPLAVMRDQVRAAHAEAGAGYVEVFVDAPVAVCAARDVKGLYAARRRGELRGLTGVDADYEAPAAPDVRVLTARQSVAECVRAILSVLPPRVKPTEIR
jgi:adenylylsulfate kinase